MNAKSHSQKILDYLKRNLTRLSVFIAVLAIAGSIYQTAATESDQRKYPPPGILVSVDGYKMHIYCIGEGSPTILLDHVGGGSSVDWALIQPRLAEHTRVCAYDRAGYGWSEFNPAPRTLEQQVNELRGLLRGANEQGPYIFVGHSYGARVGRVFAARYPSEIFGLVMMDTGLLYDDPRYPQETLTGLQNEIKMIRAINRLAPFGLLRLLRPILMDQPVYDLPADARMRNDSFVATNRFWRSMNAQMDVLPVIFKEEHNVTTLGDIPLLVLISAERDEVTTQANIETAKLSTRGRYQIVEGATHMSLAYRTDDAQVCIDGILEVLDEARIHLASQ
jgi:pimeloyl-ACP methyl ester carboxylesterase